MVRIPGGCFQMGSPAWETGRDEDERQHEVCVNTFEVGKYEVTVGEFNRFVEATNHRTDAERNVGKKGCFVLIDGEGVAWREGYSWRKPGYTQNGNYPVVCVSWNDAMAYTIWLNRATGQSYRLPTEAEWEYAARAGTTTARYWGNDPNRACQYANVTDQTSSPVRWSWNEKHECNDGYWSPAPVGRFRVNNWQLNDMLGNVWEWTCSLYDKDYSGAEKKCIYNDTISPLAVRGG
ncbi:MAG: SUMF1/EgtB/PvdO family nonheme iron enzyme, partial [Candidatus Competibacteraceae bacterium]|nr:SUMF1/EgtB/PvdO family nonheme iron enzyme [Candidatus Competibacteraceae bacterium]